MKRTPLVRRSPLRRGGRVNPVSKRRRQRDKDYEAARQAVFARARGLCEACRTDWATECNGRAEQVHHLAGRTGAEPHRLDNLLAVSAAHHRWIHAHPAQAFEFGFMVRRNGRAA